MCGSSGYKNMQLLGYEGAEYTLYEDDGVHKDYDREENYRVLKNKDSKK